MDERARRIAEAKARAEAAKAAKTGGAAPPPPAAAAPPPAAPPAGDGGDERARRIAEAKARAEAAKAAAGGAAPAPAPAAPAPPAAAAASAPAAPEAAAGGDGDDRAARIAAARARAQAAAAAKAGGAPPPAAPQRSAEEEAARQARLAAAREKAAAAGGAASAAPAAAAVPAAAAPAPARAAVAAPAARTLPAGMDEWRVPAGSAGRVVTARPDPTAVAEAQLSREEVANLVTRRSMMRTSFWAGLGVMLAGFLLGFVNFFWPRNIKGFGTQVTISKERIPAEGAEPLKVFEIKGFLVNLKAGEGVPAQFTAFGAPAEKGGLLALYQKCPHLGCAVPWRGDFDFEGVKGWFRCPCHGSTYSKAGIRVFGPAARPMDTFAITKNSDGSVVVDTGKINLGGPDNAQRAIQLS